MMSSSATYDPVVFVAAAKNNTIFGWNDRPLIEWAPVAPAAIEMMPLAVLESHQRGPHPAHGEPGWSR